MIAIDEEIERFWSAVERATERLDQLRDRAEQHAGTGGSGDLRRADRHARRRGTDQRGRVLHPAEPRRREGVRRRDAGVAAEVRAQRAPMLRERVGDLTDVHIRVLSHADAAAGPRPGRRPEGDERDPGHARPDAEPDGAARPGGHRRDRHGLRDAHVARGDPRQVVRHPGGRGPARRDHPVEGRRVRRCSTRRAACW